MELTLLNWNVQFQRREQHRTRRHQAIASLIQQYAPDICCLQEVSTHQLASLQSMSNNYHILGNVISPQLPEYVLILAHRSRWVIHSSSCFWFGRNDIAHRAWDARRPRYATTATVLPREEAAPISIPILAYHLDHVGRHARLKGAEQLVAWVNQHPRAILAGDLNADRRSPAYQHLVNKQTGLRDSRLIARQSNGPQHTWRGPLGWSRCIDHVFVDYQWSITNHTILTYPARQRPLSDHLPQLLKLGFTNDMRTT